MGRHVRGSAGVAWVNDWALHNLRRTFATNLASLAVPVYLTEKLLNRVSGTISGVAAIYNQHAHMDEMRAAVEASGKHFQAKNTINTDLEQQAKAA